LSSRNIDAGSVEVRAATGRYNGMIIPAVMLIVLALVVMRALMSFVAHEESAAPAHSITLDPTIPRNAVPGTPVPELRARADDGVRSFLLPAAEPEIVAESESTVDRARTSSS
jgi:hypothetical protein